MKYLKITLLVLLEILKNKKKKNSEKKKKSSENDQLTGHFQSIFLISPEKTVKLVRYTNSLH